MTDLVLNEDGDLDLTGGLLKLTSTVQQDALQRTKIRLGTYLGEWVYNTSVGIPYFESVLIKTNNKGPIDALFKEAILRDPDLERIKTFDSEIVLGVYYLTFEALSKSGDLVSFTNQYTA